jgi:predicted HAD superfamily Cof-like phosphohydrolase
MSAWTHALCRVCWARREPDRTPVKVKDAPSEVCCACGALTPDGIYVRGDPESFECHGKHREDADARRWKMSLQEQVAEFHRAFDQPILARPTAGIPEERVRLRARLIMEEAFETLSALFDADSVLAGGRHAVAVSTALALAKAYVDDVIDLAPVKVNLPEVADGLADLDVVIEGSRLEFGINGPRVAAVVHISNMAKLSDCPDCGGTGHVAGTEVDADFDCERCGGDGKVALKRPDGKVIKPDGWQPPDIAGEIERQKTESESSLGYAVRRKS